MKWEITIKKAENGYILEIPHVEEEGAAPVIETVVIEEENETNNTMTRVLREVADHFGFHYNKYGRDNLKISWDEAGSKVDDEEEIKN